jgi:hypothetical protein
VVDSMGFFHVVLSAHGGVLQYVRSNAPHTATAGFSTPVIIGTLGNPTLTSYTYASMVIDSMDTLHLVARSSYGHRLHYLRKRAGDAAFAAPSGNPILIDPTNNGTQPVAYAHYNQKLSIDPWNRLWLSISYQPGWLSTAQARAYQTANGLSAMTMIPDSCHPSGLYCDYYEVTYAERDTELFTSVTQGTSWRLATTPDFFF